MKDNLVILFQGDSITDGNRSREHDLNHILGHGYAYMIAGKLGSQYAEKHPIFINRGIAGDRISDLYGRWNEDAFALQPDLISILVGVNDAATIIRKNPKGYVNRYEKIYDQLLSETIDVLPNTKLVLCEPFLLKTERIAHEYEEWRKLLAEYQCKVNQLAVKYNAVFVPLQDVFDDAANRTCAEDWLWDGVHPTAAGHNLIAERWLQVVTDAKYLM